jgi:hypothetical protein
MRAPGLGGRAGQGWKFWSRRRESLLLTKRKHFSDGDLGTPLLPYPPTSPTPRTRSFSLRYHEMPFPPLKQVVHRLIEMEKYRVAAIMAQPLTAEVR